jgi:DNA-binding response OmpR family regulator
MTNQSILVVDDEGDIREMLRYAFMAAGYDVLTAADGEDALSAINHHNPTGVLLDLMMPRKNGYEVVESLRNEGQLDSLPVVILTARSIDPDERARLQGTRDILQKGALDMSGVVKRVTAALA